ALVVGFVVGVLALWSPGRRALRGRARDWPWIVAVALAGLAGDLIAFAQATAFSLDDGGYHPTLGQLGKVALGHLVLTAVTVVAALYILGGRRIALGMLLALTVYTGIQDVISISYPHTGPFQKIVLISDAAVIVAAFAGWYTMPRATQRR